MKSPKKHKKKILAFGADGKAHFAFLNGGSLKLSKDFGNLQDADNFQRYEKAVRRVIKREKPQILVCDLHPEYNSTKLAKKLHNLSAIRYPLSATQHHHAHIASSMADNNINGRVIGVAFDGTGYGSDGNIWGGEFLIVTQKKFKRAAHLDYVPMPGGEMAVREPWRMAIAYLYNSYGNKFLNIRIPFIKSINKKDALILREMMEKKINSPLTSSMGRFFDAAGSLINLTNFVKFEGEAAIKLETLAEKKKGEDSYYKAPIIKGIAKDLEQGVDRPLIAVKFHNSVARYVYDVSRKLSKIYKIKKVVLSGGVFQNNILLEKTKTLFEDSGMSLYTHKNVSTTDAGISVGQAFIMA